MEIRIKDLLPFLESIGVGYVEIKRHGLTVGSSVDYLTGDDKYTKVTSFEVKELDEYPHVVFETEV